MFTSFCLEEPASSGLFFFYLFIFVGLSEASKPPEDRWAVRVTGTLHEDVEPVKPEPAKRTVKKYPSFETWIAGSPHDSDEYDTDLEIDDFVKSEIFFTFCNSCRNWGYTFGTKCIHG